MNTGCDRPGAGRVDGRLADNIVLFARALRKAGMRVGPGAVRDALEAVLATGIGPRDDFYWTLHAVLVNRREDHATFDEAFRLFWRSHERIGETLAGLLDALPAPKKAARPRTAETRVRDALSAAVARRNPEKAGWDMQIDARRSFSPGEVLRHKDFAQMTADELGEARAAINRLRMPSDTLRTRRFTPDPRGRREDPRAMMRHALRTGGDLVLPRFRSRRIVDPPLVVLADISGSMSEYSRIFLHFIHTLMQSRRRVQAFVFGTRLTNITRPLRHRDPDEALALCATAVLDWSGGTRIGETLHAFNRTWSRRVLGQGATVLLITDGLERDSLDLLSREMERLHKSCRRLVWLNPLLRFDGFEARAGGIRAMMPHVDEFRPVHSLHALAGLCDALSAHRRDIFVPGHALAGHRRRAA